MRPHGPDPSWDHLQIFRFNNFEGSGPVDDDLGDVVLRMTASGLRLEGGTLVVDGIDVRESRAHCDSFPE